MKKYDKNGNGKLSFDEFVPYLVVTLRKLDKVEASRKKFLFNSLNGKSISITAG